MDLAKELILAVKRKNAHGGYGLQKECEALVTHVLKNMVKSNLPKLVAEVKNDQHSATFREEGNQCFVMGDDDDAIEKYTMSLAYAIDKESMALALANRSAALYRKQLYSECLIDIDTALTFGYPEDKKHKLKERAERALNALRQRYHIKDQNMNDLPSPKDSMSLLQNDNALENKNNLLQVKEFIDDKTKTKENIENDTIGDIDDLMSKIPQKAQRYVIEQTDMALAYGPNDEAPALSSGTRIVYCKKYGRHLVATKSFKPGDIILMEKPYAYVLYREKYFTHCQHCLARSYNLIPCPKCPLALYCSEKCKATDWKMAHRIECPIQTVLSKLLNADRDKIRIFTKVIRLLIIATESGTMIDEVRKDAEIAEKNPDHRTAGFTDDGIFDSYSTRSALSLATNLDTRPFIEISAFACVSALATILLAMETNFFGKKYRPGQFKDIVEKDDVKFCGTLIFRNCVIVSSNSFSIQQEPGIKAGSGLYVSASLLNHSCAPNTFRHFDGLTMMTRALEPIKEGGQIFTCYGGGYQYMSRVERKSNMLKDYFFNCDCKACIDNWPTYAEIVRNHIGSIAKTNKALVQKLKPFRQRLMMNKYDIDAVKNVLDILYAEVEMPCEEIVHAIQYLKSYYLGKFQEEIYVCKA